MADREEKETLKVSVITVAFNSEASIEKTIKSVLAQEYENLEYWIIDGASTDGTIRKAKNYKQAFEERGIAYHILSEPDKGIYDAMNKGILKVTGAVTGILNSGDRYTKDAVSVAVKTFQETGCELMFGNVKIRTDGRGCVEKKAKQRRFFQTSRDWNHPTMFVKSELYKKYPFRNLGIHDDYEFYLRMRKQKRRIVTVNQVLASFWLGGVSNRRGVKQAMKRIRDRYRFCYRINGYSRWYLIECISMEAAKWLYTRWLLPRK